MSSGVVVHVAPESSRKPGLALPQRDASTGDGAVEDWLGARLNFFVFGVIAAGFLLRIYVAGRSFLNPDEALHYVILNQRSAFLAYKLSLTNAHPPLIYLLVYYWSFLGRSEWMLRFPSVLAGTAACWFAYKWIETMFGKAAGVIGLILVAFSPAMIALSAELRSYALLVFCETAALYFAEIALREKSVRKMWYFTFFLYMAILSHYSAMFFVLAAGVYVLARTVESRLPRKVSAAWAGGQAGALGLYAFLYVTHVSKLHEYIAIWAFPFIGGYFHPGREKLFTFAWERTSDIFAFLFENNYVARAMLAVWIVAIAVLLLREFSSRGEKFRARFSGILLALPILAVFGAAVAGFYPFVGSRHTVFLAPFLIAALSFLLAAVYGQKLWAAMLIAILLVGASNTSGKTFEPFITRENQNRANMDAALIYIKQAIPTGGLIMSDYQSAIILTYYLCGPKLILPVGTFNLPASRVKCNGYTIASLQTWEMQSSDFLAQFGKSAHAQRLTAGDTVWVFQSGWGVFLGKQLPFTSPEFRCIGPRTFGANISIFPVAVGPDFSPVATVTSCPPPAFNSFIE